MMNTKMFSAVKGHKWKAIIRLLNFLECHMVIFHYEHITLIDIGFN
jgi:hypothetical protein